MATLSKRAYAILATAAVIIFAIGMFFSRWGCSVFQGWINSAYEECPQAERKTQKAADWQMKLAWWYGVSLRDEEAQACYDDFLDNKKDWGWTHPRAPEAAFNRMMIWEKYHSWQRNCEECTRVLELICKHPRYKEVYPDFDKFMVRNRGSMPEWAVMR